MEDYWRFPTAVTTRVLLNTLWLLLEDTLAVVRCLLAVSVTFNRHVRPLLKEPVPDRLDVTHVKLTKDLVLQVLPSLPVSLY